MTSRRVELLSPCVPNTRPTNKHAATPRSDITRSRRQNGRTTTTFFVTYSTRRAYVVRQPRVVRRSFPFFPRGVRDVCHDGTIPLSPIIPFYLIKYEKRTIRTAVTTIGRDFSGAGDRHTVEKNSIEYVVRAGGVQIGFTTKATRATRNV